jgi:hypothetical protein
MTSDHRKDVLTLLGIGAVGALVIAWLIGRSAPRTSDPLAAVPDGAFVVATLDVRAIAESPIGEALFGDKGARASTMLGVDSLEATCGFDPLPRVRAVAVSLPEGETHGDFGLAATGDLAKGSLEACAKAVIAKRGGHATTRQQGTFTLVSDDDPKAGSIAMRDGGPFLLGKGPWLDAMIEAAEGRRASMAHGGDEAHRALRGDLEKREPGGVAVEVTALVPRELRDRVRKDMEGVGDAAKLGATMDGVLSAGAVGLAIHAGRDGEEARFTAEVQCDGDAAAAACESVEKTILHFRLGWSGDLRLRLVGLGPLIDGLDTKREGATLVLRTHAPASDLAHAINRVTSMSGRSKPAPPPPPSPKPDELVKP